MEPEAPPTQGTLARLWETVGSRLLFFAGVIALAVGSIALLVTLLDDEDPKGVIPPTPSLTEEERRVAEVDPEARKVAGKFILTAVARRNVDQSWAITHPDLRAGYTRKEWATGNLPIVPYPTRAISEARFRVDALEENLIQLDVALLPRAGSGITKAGVFKIGLVAVGEGENRRWLVDYWGPSGGPPIPTPPR